MAENNVEDLYFTSDTLIDDKSRIIIPKHVREWLKDSPVLVHWESGALALFRAADWKAHEDYIRSASKHCLGRIEYERMVISTKEPGVKFDAQGRMVVGRYLKKVAKLAGRIILKGMGAFVEIWAEDELDEKLKHHDGYMDGRFAQIRTHLADIEEALRGAG